MTQVGKWRVIMNSRAIQRAIERMTLEILEKEEKPSELALVGIRRGGEHLAQRIAQQIKKLEGTEVPLGTVDITLYRDDFRVPENGSAKLLGSDLPFRVSGSRIILIDDVLYTGRTIRAALDAIVDFGRPRRVELAVLVDRGHREFPIRPDYIGRTLTTFADESVRLRLKETGLNEGEEEGVFVRLREHSKTAPLAVKEVE